MVTPVTVPAPLREATILREGESGREWINALPDQVDALIARWDCVPTGEPVSGQVGIVVSAQSGRYGAVVLKVSFPHPANMAEPIALGAWGGQGAVRLFEHDPTSVAMLLERIETRSLEDVADIDEAVAVAGDLARRFAVPAPPGIPRVTDIMADWQDVLWRALNRKQNQPPRRVTQMARATFDELWALQPETVIHGDLHYGNVLRGRRERWQAIDPKGLVGDRAFDIHHLLINRAIPLLGTAEFVAAMHRRVAVFAEAAGLDREHVRRWAQMRAVISAQYSWERQEPKWISEAKDVLADLLTEAG
ncbi:MAG: aminoglycoside phosphotransferase family protein [Mycobacteriales bacterium]